MYIKFLDENLSKLEEKIVRKSFWPKSRFIKSVPDGDENGDDCVDALVEQRHGRSAVDL
jgi:hypothetical protein